MAEKQFRTAAVIAEFNPFHNGHAAILRKAREKAGADFLIVVMSGDYVQRGEPAVVEKFTRTRMALMNGADLVLELPLFYALGSAEYFALGAVSLLHRLNVVDALVFGSECGDAERLGNLAQILSEESAGFKMNLQLALKSGNDYPTARTKALQLALPKERQDDISLLTEPNNLLGVEYMKQMIRAEAGFSAVTVKRTAGLSSSGIRASILPPNGRLRRSQMPESCAVLLTEYAAHGGYNYGNAEHIAEKLAHVLALDSPQGVVRFADVSDDLAAKIYKQLPFFSAYGPFVEALHTKDLTQARVRRALMHIFLHMTQASLNEYTQAKTVYARVLGFRRDAQPLLNKIKTNSRLPLITKLTQSTKILADDTLALRLFREDIRASLIYDQCFRRPEAYPIRSDYEKPIVTM